MTNIAPADFDFIRNLVRDCAAIVLEPGKEYLVESRLGPVAERERFGSLADFVAALRREVTRGPLQMKAVDALTTNETYFFRDFHPFEALRRNLLPDLITLRESSRKLTIWCAACSTGQEPLSIAMLIREHFPQLATWQVEIIATDLSPTVLQQAQAGRYNQIEVNRGLPALYLVKYFTQEGETWVIKPQIRQMVQYRPLNLIQPWPILPPCDLIFMRNVMIYFDVPTKQGILKKLRRCLRPQGSLLLGASETTLNLDPQWAVLKQGGTVVYRPTDAAATS